MSVCPFKGVVATWVVGKVASQRCSQMVGGSAHFLGCSFPTPTPATHTGMCFPWIPVSVRELSGLTA